MEIGPVEKVVLVEPIVDPVPRPRHSFESGEKQARAASRRDCSVPSEADSRLLAEDANV